MTFSDLHLIPALLRAVEESGYQQPSPIQEKAIPPVLKGRDLLGCAQTGTGKTAAFALPILQRLAGTHVGGRPIRALILTPTRELALQIDECFEAYGRYLPLAHAVIFGGVGQAPQVAALQRGVDILTATPGRLNDLIGQGHVRLDKLEVFVLDEADRMLDMGFVHDVKRVIAKLPAQRQNLLFSATMPKEIEQLAGTILRSPEKVMVTPPATTVEKIRQSVYFAEKAEKKQLLPRLLRDADVESALVFTRTKHGANRVVTDLARAGIEAMAIHGNKSQTARQTALGRFKAGELKVLVATDIAARGIDVSGLSHVFNYDLPNVPETYVHRIGRTGRAGRDGVAVSFCSEEERPYLKEIEKLTRQKIPVRRAEAAQEAPAKGSEHIAEREIVMEDTRKESAAQPGAQEGAPARRRRRGGRRHNKNRQGAAPGAPQEQAAQAAQAAPQPPRQESQSEQPKAERARRRGGRGRSGRPEAGSAPQQGGRPVREEKAERPARSRGSRPARSGPSGAEFSEEDNSIQLISRRVPAQKFASFEEYMKAHGLGGGVESGGSDDE